MNGADACAVLVRYFWMIWRYPLVFETAPSSLGLRDDMVVSTPISLISVSSLTLLLVTPEQERKKKHLHSGIELLVERIPISFRQVLWGPMASTAFHGVGQDCCEVVRQFTVITNPGPIDRVVSTKFFKLPLYLRHP